MVKVNSNSLLCHLGLYADTVYKIVGKGKMNPKCKEFVCHKIIQGIVYSPFSFKTKITLALIDIPMHFCRNNLINSLFWINTYNDFLHASTL